MRISSVFLINFIKASNFIYINLCKAVINEFEISIKFCVDLCPQ
jgi:hypothetical protein